MHDIFQSGIGEWRNVFLVTAGVYCLGALMFLLLGSGEEQPWSKVITSLNVQQNHKNHSDDYEKQVEHWIFIKMFSNK